MSDWQEILGRVLDGDSLTPEESSALQTALETEEQRKQALEWMRFESSLSCVSLDESLLEVSRERLLARVVLREKHAEVLADGLPEDDSAVDSGSAKTPLFRSPTTAAPSGVPPTRRGGRRTWVPVVLLVAIAVVIAGSFWPGPSNNSYAGPQAHGDFRVLGVVNPQNHEHIERGDRIVSGGHGARMELGSYCRLELDSYTDVTINGAPHREVVELHQGSLKARITPNHGRFLIRTPLGSITVQGTEFQTTVEYPNGMPGDLSMNSAKKVVVTVAVLSGSVLCELGDEAVLLNGGSQEVFADEIDSRKTDGEVTATSKSTVTVKTKSGEQAKFQIGENKLTAHEASQLTKGDKVSISWVEERGQRWIRDIEGEGVLEGKVSGLGDAWLEVQTAGNKKVKLRAPWRGGNPSDGGGPDREVVEKLGQVSVGDQVAVTWAMPEGKRVMDVRVRKTTDLTKAPPELYGLSGRVIGRLVSKDVEKGELTLKIVEVDRVWPNNKAKKPKSAEGRTLKIDGVFGKFLDVLLTLKKNDGVQVEVKHVRGDGLTFLGEELKRVEIEERDKEQEGDSADAPAGLRGFRGILIGKLVSKDVENGTLVFEMEKVKRVWKANKAPAPEKSKGKLISVEGISGKFLDTLLVLEKGTRIEVEAFHVRGKTLKFPGEWLKKAE